MKILLYDLGGKREEYNEPLGVEVVASSLRKRSLSEGVNVNIDVGWYYQKGENPSIDNLSGYDIVGFSLPIGSLSRFRDVYARVKASGADQLIVVGNVIPTYAYKSILSEFGDAICVRGEGEDACYSLLKLALINKGRLVEALKCIPNIAFNDGQGKVISNQVVPVDMLKYPEVGRDFLGYINDSGGIARIESSRGCHWGKCRFCCVQGKYGSSSWRPIPIDKIIYEMEELGKSNVKFPYFTDEDFLGGNFDRSRLLAKEILKAKREGRVPKEMGFFISIMASDVTDPNGFLALREMRQAGLREVFVGIESGEKKQLNRYNKKANVKTNIRAIAKLKQLGVSVDIGYILFDPLMTFTELEISVEFLKRLKYDSIDARSIKCLRIQPGTDICNDYQDVITGDLDVDQLCYPYKNMDSMVSDAFDLYNEYEHNMSEQVYAMQAEARGEVGLERQRKEIKRQLSTIRNNDFIALEKILAFIKSEMPKSSLHAELNKLISANDRIADQYTKQATVLN